MANSTIFNFSNQENLLKVVGELIEAGLDFDFVRTTDGKWITPKTYDGVLCIVMFCEDNDIDYLTSTTEE